MGYYIVLHWKYVVPFAFIWVIGTSVLLLHTSYRNYEVNASFISEYLQQPWSVRQRYIEIGREMKRVLAFNWESPIDWEKLRVLLYELTELIDKYETQTHSVVIGKALTNDTPLRDQKHNVASLLKRKLYSKTKPVHDGKPKKSRPVKDKLEEPTPLSGVLSILINGLEYANTDEVIVLLDDIQKMYRNITVHLTVAQTLSPPLLSRIKLNVVQHRIGAPSTAPLGYVWNRLVGFAKTKYVLIGRRLRRVSGYAQLARMISIASRLDAGVVGGSIQTPDGHWTADCQQVVLRNNMLRYTNGYSVEKKTCVLCDHLESPFISQTSILRETKFRLTSSQAVFADFFLRLRRGGKLVLSCPDSTFHVRAENETRAESKAAWLPVAYNWSVSRISFGNGHSVSFSCQESNLTCSWKNGLADQPVCCIEALLIGLYNSMPTCQSMKVFCFLDEATVDAFVAFNDRIHITGLDQNDELRDWEDVHATLRINVEGVGGCFADSALTATKLYIPGWPATVCGVQRAGFAISKETNIEPMKVWLGGIWFNAAYSQDTVARGLLGTKLRRATG